MDDTAERIYLPRLPAFKESTFCVDQADTDTVEYIRADLHQKALDRIEALEAENARLKDAFQLYVDANERVLELESKLVRYNEVVGDKINLRAEIAELKAENKR